MKYLSLTIPGGENGITIDAPGGIPTGGFTNSTTGNSILGWALQVAFVIAVILIFFLIIWGGIQWLTSGGEKEKIANARKRIMYAIFGLVVIVLSIFLINILLSFFGAPTIGVNSASAYTSQSSCEKAGFTWTIGDGTGITGTCIN